MAAPAVSVLLSTYNRPETLAGAVASVAGQSFPDWELLVINDGGVDIAGVMQGFTDPRIRVLQRDTNRGKPACSNFGIRQARADLIAYIDDDDIWLPDHLAVLTSSLAAHPACGGAYSDLLRVVFVPDGQGGRIPLDKRVLVSHDFNRSLALHSNQIHHVSFLHRKELAERVGGYDETITVLDDWNLSYKLAFVADMWHVPRVTGEYWVPLGRSDRNSDLERTDPKRFIGNLRRIRADMPARPWPHVASLAVILPLESWDAKTADRAGAVLDGVSHPARFLLVDRNAGRGPAPSPAMEEILGLVNVERLVPPRPMSLLEAYRFGAERAESEFLYLATLEADNHKPFRLFVGLEALADPGLDAVAWETRRPAPHAEILARREPVLKENGAFRLSVKTIDRPLPRSMRFYDLVAEAERLRGQGRWPAAHRALREAAAMPASPPADEYFLGLFAETSRRAGRPEEIIDYCRRLIASGHAAHTSVVLGNCLLAARQPREALRAFDNGLRAVGITNDHLSRPVFPLAEAKDLDAYTALTGIADCLAAMGQADQAARMYRTAMGVQSLAGPAWIGLARLHAAQGRTDQAEAVLREALGVMGPREEITTLMNRLRSDGSGGKPASAPGRNDPCPCGSGRKYKKCCLGRAGSPPSPAAP